MFALALFGCGGPPTFPTTPPASPPSRYSLGPEDKPKPPPVPKGVAQFEMDPETRPRIAIVVAISVVVFIVALVIALAMHAMDRVIPAGIAAAFLGPVVALLIAARRLSRVLTGLASAPFFFADFALAMWNENQPLLAGLYCGSILLVILMAIAAFKKSESERGGLVTLSTLLLAMIAAIVSFASFVSMNRLLLAMLDPITTDALPRTLRFTTLGAAAQMMQALMITTLSAAAISSIILILTLVMSFVVRRIRAPVVVTLLALILMLAAAAVDRTWSEVLESSARTGHVPETLLTR
jgi:hypothetical protein